MCGRVPVTTGKALDLVAAAVEGQLVEPVADPGQRLAHFAVAT